MKKILIFISIVLVLAVAYLGLLVLGRLFAGDNASPANNIIETVVDNMFRIDRGAVTPPNTEQDPFGNQSGRDGIPTSGTTPKPSAPIETVDLPGRDGKTVKVLVFLPPLASTTATSSVPGLAPNTDVDITQTRASSTPYRIVYMARDQSFTIGLYTEPLRETRLAAEAELQQLLGISNVDMCRIKHVVLVPIDVNEFYSGQNLGFSFCPGAIKL